MTRGMFRQGGFTLIEMLIVVLLVGILAAVAAPVYLGYTTNANAAAAVEGVRLLHAAEMTYQAGVGNSSFGTATNLFQQDFIDGVLAGAAGVEEGTTSISGDQVVPGSTAGKDGYIFAVEPSEDLEHFHVVARPVGINRTGDRVFFIDETGVIRVTCTPPKHLDPLTGQCEGPEFTAGLAIDSLVSIDQLADGLALTTVLESPPSDDTIRRILEIIDDNGDGCLTSKEILKADILAFVRSVLGTSPPTDSAGIHADRKLESILLGFEGGLARELAVGLGNEKPICVPLTAMNGSPIRLLELAVQYASSGTRTTPR